MSSDSYPTLPKEYWPCPLCLITLLRAHGEGRIDHSGAYDALKNSGLVESWPEGGDDAVRTTKRGAAFVEMLLATPLPVMRWMDPRQQQDFGEQHLRGWEAYQRRFSAGCSSRRVGPEDDLAIIDLLYCRHSPKEQVCSTNDGVNRAIREAYRRGLQATR